MRKFQTTLLLLLLLLASAVQTQAQSYTVNQNIINLTPIPNCSGSNVPSYNSQSNAVVMSVQVDVNHDISGVVHGSPQLVSTVNSHGTRKVKFKIYPNHNGSPGSTTPEAVVTKTQSWLHGAAVNNGSSSRVYSLTGADLATAGLSSGPKVVVVETEFYYCCATPHVINLEVANNGVAACSKAHFDTWGNRLVCDQGYVSGCFNFQACDVHLSILGQLQEVQGPGGWVIISTYGAYIKGGSGNFSYQWTRSGSSNVGTNSSYSFFGTASVFLALTDNATGCVYYANNKQNLVEDLRGSRFEFTVGPNPAQVDAPLKAQFLLKEATEVRFEVFNLNGQKLQDLGQPVKGERGINNVELQPRGLSAGIYFVRINAGEQGTLMKKIVLNR